MSRFNRSGSALFIAGFAAIFAAAACGNSEDGNPSNDPKGGSSSAAGSSNTAGKVTGGTGGGSASNGGSAGSSAMAGKPSTAGSSGQTSGGTGNSEAGSGGGAGEGNGGTPSEAGAGGGGGKDDPRPGCAKVPDIELSNLHLVEGAGPGETAKLEIDVTNGTDEFVSYNAVKIKCTGDAVDSAFDEISVFGISQGGMYTVGLNVVFKDDAQAGDVASCTVRGFILGKSPEDCQNAQTLQLDVTVE